MQISVVVHQKCTTPRKRILPVCCEKLEMGTKSFFGIVSAESFTTGSVPFPAQRKGNRTGRWLIQCCSSLS